MTWNLRTDSATDGPTWPERRDAVAATVRALRPTVLGVQEASTGMLQDLLDRLTEPYAWVGEGRDGRGRGERCAVVYDPRRLTVLDVRNRWLSPTPDRPGSVAPGAALPRLSTAARFHDAETDSVLTVVNTHLDFQGGRVEAAALVAAEAPAPAVVVGDVNDVVGSEAYGVLLGAGLVDALAPRDRPNRRLATFVGFADPPPGEGEQIDWVLTTPDLTVADAWVVEPDEPYASDHRPVVVDLALDGESAA